MAITEVKKWIDSFNSIYNTKEEAEEGDTDQLLVNLITSCYVSGELENKLFIKKLRESKSLLKRIIND